MFTPASEISGFFIFLFFYFRLHPISFHVTYTYFIVENIRTSDHMSGERERKTKKKITLLIMALEGRLDEREADIAIFFNVK